MLFDENVERSLNPRLSTPNYNDLLKSSLEKAKASKSNLHGIFDLKYGSSFLQSMDVFFNKNENYIAPIHIFIHGGYWRGLDKAYHTHMAIPFTKNNICFFNVNYDLCPKVKLSDIKNQIISAILWIYKNAKSFYADNQNIVISGHSAGAHLASLMLSVEWDKYGIDKSVFKGIGLISGIFNTEMVLNLKVNQEIGLTDKEALLNNSFKKEPKIVIPTIISYGAKEPCLWIQQSQEFACHLNKYDFNCQIIVCKNDNHFTLIDTLANLKRTLVKKMIMLSYK